MKNERLLRIPLGKWQLVFGISIDLSMFHVGIGILNGGLHLYIGHIKLFSELWISL